MQKGQTKGEKGLTHKVHTRLDEEKYQELQQILKKTKDETLSSAVRKIIHNKPIRIYVHDETTDLLLEELATLRNELKAIGVNLNQITRFFNTYPEERKKHFYAKLGIQLYLQVEPKTEALLEIMSKLAEKWLRE